MSDIMTPFGLAIDLETGDMLAATNRLVRRASDMRGYYADAEALDRLIQEQDDPLHYEVYELPVPQEQGQLMYCISKLQPGQVGQEFFMTKGHYHTISATAEIYLCLAGQGYMVMKTVEGQWAAQEMMRGRMVYVPPYWAHRSVNTDANETLVSFCVYPGDAGHNYGDIEREGLGKRVLQREGDIIFE